MHGQLADDTPDRKAVSVVSIEAAATVDVQRDRPHYPAHDTDRLDSDAMLVTKRRRQQRPSFNRQAHAFFFLEHPFPQYALQEQTRAVISSSGLASTRNSPTASQFFATP